MITILFLWRWSHVPFVVSQLAVRFFYENTSRLGGFPLDIPGLCQGLWQSIPSRTIKKAYFDGIRGRAFKWIEYFIDNRSQQLVIDGHFSIDVKIASGVPQGGVLGPLLFLVCINDLPNCVKCSVCRLFADDCILCQRIRSCQDGDKLQADLDQLKKWESIWLMEFHTSRCQVISVTNKVKPIIGKYQVQFHILEQVICAKYLCIYMDSNLAFNTHVNAIVKKSNSTVAFIARNIPRCCRKVK